MAIKGKTKSRSRRVVAAPPRPPVYVRKPPLLRRKWFLATLAAVALAGILAAVLVSLDNRAEAALKDRTIDAVDRFTSRVNSNFPPPPDSQPVPPTGYAIYPTLTADLDAVAKGSKDVDGAAKGKSLEESARASAAGIEAVQVRETIPIEANVGANPGTTGPGTTRVVLIDAQYLIVQAFRTFETVGGLMRRAATATGEERKALIQEAKDLTNVAQDLFRTGYGKIQSVKAQLEDLEVNPFPAPGTGGAP